MSTIDERHAASQQPAPRTDTRSKWMPQPDPDMGMPIITMEHAIDADDPALWTDDAVKTPEHMTRAKCLDAARACVLGDREVMHGAPEDVFPMIAELWSIYTGTKIASYDVAAMMVLLKVARFAHNPKNEDGPIDMAGYAACAAELAP